MKYIERAKKLKWQALLTLLLLCITSYFDLMGAFRYGVIMTVTYFPYAIFFKN